MTLCLYSAFKWLVYLPPTRVFLQLTFIHSYTDERGCHAKCHCSCKCNLFISVKKNPKNILYVKVWNNTDQPGNLQSPISTTQSRSWKHWEQPASCRSPTPADTPWTSLQNVSHRQIRLVLNSIQPVEDESFCKRLIWSFSILTHLPTSADGASSIWCSRTTSGRWRPERGC